MRHFYNQCVYSLVPTDPIKNELVENGIEPGRLLTWGRGIDAAQFNPKFRDDAYMDSLAGKGTRRILFVSRLVWEKEIKTLVGIYKKLESERPDIKMILTGDGPQRRYMEKTMPRAIFTGKLLGNELSRIYASSDLFVFPSITETFGNVVLEALSSGLPCVVAAQGGPMGIVKNGVTGFHARPKDPDDFVSKILMILDKDTLFKKMKNEAVSYARSQNWDTLCGQMFALYERIYADSRGINHGRAVGIK
jgi:glycosyltransferase involved in cell wall biosynthesis